jgi:outer membrane biosynthesis protein TonB
MKRGMAGILAVVVGSSCAPSQLVTFATCPPVRTASPAMPDTTIYDTLTVTTRPKAARVQTIHYPEALRRRMVGGRVTMEAVIGPDGRVEPQSVRAVFYSDSAFVAPSVASVRGSEFCPGLIEGRPVRVRVQIPITYVPQRDSP